MDSRLPPTSSSSYSRISSTPLKRVDPNTTYTAPPSVLTRSMSRKSLASSTSNSSNVGLLTRSVRGVGGMESEAVASNRRRLIIQPKPSRIGTLSTSRNLGTTTSSRLPGPRRSVLSGLNELASAPSGPVSSEMKRSVRSGGLAGIGQVRRGPPVVQGYNLSPPKPTSVEGARNPYSLEFRADLIVRDGGAGMKSGLKLHDGMTGGSKPNDQNVRPSSTSPAKRYDYPTADNRRGEIDSFSHNFNSPPRTTTPATSTTPRYAPPVSPTRPHVVYMDTQPPSDFSIHRDLPPSLLSSPAPSTMRRRKHGDSDTSEDELDFLSPKKIRLEEGVGRPSVGMLRSPMKPRQGGMGLASTRKMNISPIKITALKEGISVPMQRATYALPPFPSTSTSTSTSAFNTGGQGGLLAKLVASAQPAPPIVLAAAAPRKSGIPQRRISIPLASVSIQQAPLRQIPPFRALHQSTSSGPLPLAAPLPARSFAPIPLTTAPQAPVVLADSSMDSVADETTFAFSQSRSPGPFDQTFNTTLDTSLFLAPDADHSMNSTSTTEHNQSVMSEETAQRLNNLQAMLSKLSMPRSASTSFSSSSGRLSLPLTQEEPRGGRMLPTSITGINRDRAVGKERKENLGRDRRRDEAKMSLNPSDHLVSGAGKTSSLSSSSRSSLPSSSSSRLIAPLASNSKTNGSFIPQSVSQPTSRRTSVNIPTSRSTAAISAQLDGGEISSKPKTYILRGVVAFVDVRTLEGDDAGMIFVDMLKSMGARVTQRPTLTLTHIIYKSGKPSTLNHLKDHPDPQPFCVGISWVVKCAEVGAKVDEKKYTVVIDENVFVGAQKRRRSMEPKALAALNSSLGPGGNSGSDPKLRATIAASIERARRKSLQFQPKIGSPLSKRVFMLAPDLDEDAEMV